MRITIAALLWLCADLVSAFQPRTGHWNNLSESGSGYNIDVQNGVMVVTVYSYQSGGAAQWYIASGPTTNAGRSFVGNLDKFQGGQCIGCTFAGAPAAAGNDGTIAITFASETAATVTLPGGRITQIQPFDFAFGPLPEGLLGEWIFVYDIIAGSNTYAERFNVTTLKPATAAGTGVAQDAARSAACEYQVSGVFAGKVICVDLDSMGRTQNQYVPLWA